MSVSEKDAIQRRDEAIDLLEKHAHGTKPAERDWLIDQIAQTLLGDEYGPWVEAYERDGKAIPVRKWLTGVEPAKERKPRYEEFSIQRGDIWVNKRTGKEVIILRTVTMNFQDVELQHESGRITSKGHHYFIEDYEPKGGQKD